MNYFPFHLGDYAAHTAHLEPMEDLAYRRLLDQYYLREGALPADIQATAKLIRMRSMIADVESVLKEFFVLTEAGWTHARCENEITHMQDKQAKARASAAASVKSRQAFAAKHLNSKATPVDETANRRSTGVENIPTDVELPTPTPTPTPTPVIKERESAAKAPRPAKKCPDGFEITEAMQIWAKEQFITVHLQTETEKFKDHTFPRAIGDWKGAWRNWIRKAQEYADKNKITAVRGLSSEPAWRREQRERTANAVPGIAAKSIYDKPFIDLEIYDVTTLSLD